MKKELIVFVMVLLILGIVSAANISGQAKQVQGQNTGEESEITKQIGNDSGLGQTIRERVKAGTYISENGKEIEVSELANKLRLRVRNVSVDCDCNLTQEKVQNKTRLKIQLSNGKNIEIKIMPDVASETALQRLRIKVCSQENNCTIQLKEVGTKNKSELRAAYEMQIERHARILGLFRTKMQSRIQIDAENGEIIQIKKPWWAFLASEESEE